MSFKHLRVRSKLMLGFVLLAAVVLLVSGLSLQSLGRANGRFTDYLASVGARERLATDLRGAAMQRAIAARNLVLVTGTADRAAEAAAVTQADNDMKTALSRLDAAVKADPDTTEAERRQVADIHRIDAAYRLVATDIVAKALAGEREAAVQKMNVECRPLLAELLAAAAGYIGHEQAQAAEQVAQAQAGYGRDRALLLAVCIAAVASALGLGLLLARAIVTPLAHAVKVAEAVASGDLGSCIEVDRRDETGQLLAALQRMNGSLVQMVGRVRQSADGIATASTEIAIGNQDLSSRTEQQASALQETAASMQQMTGAVQQSADSARQASELAGSAAAAANRGGEVVQRVVATMAEITEASQRIGDIIGTIDGIAFQTNILALNAAVEAARAGEQGRGFAVVAEEVRTLARRAAEAAREIKVLVGNSVGRVEAGSQLVGEAGGTMTDLVEQVRGMSSLIGDINTRTSEQSLGIGQVNQAVAAIDQGTQQNAALVEQSAAAAESLRQQASGLLELVAAFRMPAQA